MKNEVLLRILFDIPFPFCFSGYPKSPPIASPGRSARGPEQGTRSPWQPLPCASSLPAPGGSAGGDWAPAFPAASCDHGRC